MNRSKDGGFLVALRDACTAAHKQIAMMTWTECGPNEAQSKLARVLAGELNPPPALLSIVLRGPHPEPLHRWIERAGHVEIHAVRDPASVLRERACVALVRLEEQLSLIRDELRAADESEHIEHETRRAMAKTQPRTHSERRRA